MRLLSVRTGGIGGLLDGEVDLPTSAVAAIAGGNGTGKTKLLACLLSPWTGALPTSRAGGPAEVAVQIAVDAAERASLNELSMQVGWGVVDVPERFWTFTRSAPLAGVTYTSEPQLTVLANFARHQGLLKLAPSLDVLYLPAERRLLPANTSGIDLNQLSEDLAVQMSVNARGSVQSYGRLDDAEFEQFAKALCVAGQLGDDQDDPAAPGDRSRLGWDEFKAVVDSLISPKRLLPLTRRHPESLRIATPDGSQHGVQDLSSGERQALIIVSRILRAGTGHGVVIIDEPDAYLHPSLSRRLAVTLEAATGSGGQLVLATHSPAVLDALAPSSILRLSHARPAARVADEAERLDVYRDAGFRASALTQSDLLIVTEGDADATLLPLLIPDLARATLRPAGGRTAVLADVGRLHRFELPVLGVVDGDVFPDVVPVDITALVTVWEAGDIEGVFLSDDQTLTVMADRGLLRPPYDTIDAARVLLDGLAADQRENAVAELAQRLLRRKAGINWPTPRGERPVQRLREAVRGMAVPSENDLLQALQTAEELWLAHEHDKWRLVRGKYILPLFAQAASVIPSGQALLEAVARARPDLVRLRPFTSAVRISLDRTP